MTFPLSALSQPGSAPVIIALMGATGTGKTTFINLASGANLTTGDGLESCTTDVQQCHFKLNERDVVLIDTPGFDDTNLSETEVVNKIVAHLETAYREDTTLTGILYLHRISDTRMGGASRKNFSMFRSLCGDETLKNVVVVTTMWGDVLPEKGASREEQLKAEEKFFKPAIDNGAKMVRHDNTPERAKEIIWDIVQSNSAEPLCIQKELVNEGKNIIETSVGQQLDRNLVTKIEGYETELQRLRRALEAQEQQNEANRKELQEERDKTEAAMETIKELRQSFPQDYEKERDKTCQTISQLQRDRRDFHDPRTSHEYRRKLMERIKSFARNSPLGYVAHGITNAVKSMCRDHHRGVHSDGRGA